MPVFKRPNEKTYSYRFQYRGNKFSGQTYETDKRRALILEDKIYRDIVERHIDGKKPLTFNAAASRYWTEHGQNTRNAKDLFRQIGWLEKHIGRSTLITELTDSDIAAIVAKRRGEIVRNKPLSNAAVNRSVINPLRRILNRARDVWKKPVPNIDWPRHVLVEPRERIREASFEEQDALIHAMRDDYVPAIVFTFLTGCRMAEVVDLTWHDVDWFNRTFKVLGKGDKHRIIPMSEPIYNLLWKIKDNHLESVFTYQAKRAGPGKVRGKHYAITYNGLKTAWRRYKAKAGVKDFRFHDMRHTMATRLLRQTGNLRMAQKLLGHADIATTTRYSHVLVEDLRNGMNATHSAENNTKNCTTEKI